MFKQLHFYIITLQINPLLQYQNIYFIRGMLIILISILIISSYNQCPLSTLPLASATQQFSDILASLSKEQLFGCVELLFQRGYYQTCKQIVEGNPQWATMLDHRIAGRQGKLKSLLESLDMPQSFVQPSVKWAQNISHVFISYKLSHRLDSPPCVNIKHQKKKVLNIQNANGIIQQKHIDKDNNESSYQYHCECIVSHQRVFFDLKLRFQQKISGLEVKKQGVGSYTIVIEKGQQKIWRWLDKSQKRWSVWDQIKIKYSDYMRKYFDMIEEEQDRKIKKTKNKRKKIPLQQPKIEENKPDEAQKSTTSKSQSTSNNVDKNSQASTEL